MHIFQRGKFRKIKVFLFGFDSKTNIKDDKSKSQYNKSIF